MYENKITKTFRDRRSLLRGSFPSAWEFLDQLENKSAPAVWMHTGNNCAVYWEDGFMLYVRFVDIGEVNTGIRLSPDASQSEPHTVDRSHLLLPDALERLIRQHDGFRHLWAKHLPDGSFDLRHPAPSTFFRDLVALIERMGAQNRAAMNAEAFEAELRSSEAEVRRDLPGLDAFAAPDPKGPPATRQAHARTSSPRPSPTKPSPPRPRREPTPVAVQPVPEALVRESARPMNRTNTQRILTFEHLVDAYFDFGAHCDEDDPLCAYYKSRLEGLEALFLCRLPRPGRGARAAASDRGQVVELAWRCVNLANGLKSPFLAPVSEPEDSLLLALWQEHGPALGMPVEDLRRASRAAFRSALLALFPGISDTVVGEADLVDFGLAEEPPSP